MRFGPRFHCVLLLAAIAGMGAVRAEEEDRPFKGFVASGGWTAGRGGQFTAGEGGTLRITLPGWVQKRASFPWRTRDWSRYNGISFRVKGDGSENHTCLEVVGQSGWGWFYAYYFPVSNREWKTYRVHWSDFVPHTNEPGPLDAPGCLGRDGIDMLRFGDRWTIGRNNAKRTQFSFEVADVRLVEDAVPELEIGRWQPPPFAAFRDRLRSGRPVTINCYGDSITAGTGLRNPSEERYAAQLQKELRSRLKRQDITVQGYGVGGARTGDVLAWINRDLLGAPDLVTLMIGFNNKSSAMAVETFKAHLELWIDRVAARTKGRTCILLIPTLPGGGVRFTMMDDYAQAVCQVAAHRGLPVCRADQAIRKLGRTKASEYFHDFAHPNPMGHRLIANALADLLVAEE